MDGIPKDHIIASSTFLDNCGMLISMIHYDQAVHKISMVGTTKVYHTQTSWQRMEQIIAKTRIAMSRIKIKLWLQEITVFEDKLPVFSAPVDGKQGIPHRGSKATSHVVSNGDTRWQSNRSHTHRKMPTFWWLAMLLIQWQGQRVRAATTLLWKVLSNKLVNSVVVVMTENKGSLCTANTMSLVFMRYWVFQPKEFISLEELLASRSMLTT